jgi:hypothetical protein
MEYQVPGGGATDVAVGDVDRDGNPDIVTANYSTNDVTVLLSSQGYGTTNNFAAGTGPRSIAILDYNLDGRPDLAAANEDGKVGVFYGYGTGSFLAGVSHPSVASLGSLYSLAVGDLNRDGMPDIVASDTGGFADVLLKGNGPDIYPFIAALASGGTPESVALADFNRDGKLDIVQANSTDNNVFVWLNTTK